MQSTVQDSTQADCVLVQTEDVEEAYHDGAPEPSGMEFPPDGAAENSHPSVVIAPLVTSSHISSSSSAWHMTVRSHMPAASHKWEKTIELCQSGYAETEQRSNWLVAHPN